MFTLQPVTERTVDLSESTGVHIKFKINLSKTLAVYIDHNLDMQPYTHDDVQD